MLRLLATVLYACWTLFPYRLCTMLDRTKFHSNNPINILKGGNRLRLRGCSFAGAISSRTANGRVSRGLIHGNTVMVERSRGRWHVARQPGNRERCCKVLEYEASSCQECPN
jgi:hypothetical protein